jgi:hypothetical protein
VPALHFHDLAFSGRMNLPARKGETHLKAKKPAMTLAAR